MGLKCAEPQVLHTLFAAFTAFEDADILKQWSPVRERGGQRGVVSEELTEAPWHGGTYTKASE